MSRRNKARNSIRYLTAEGKMMLTGKGDSLEHHSALYFEAPERMLRTVTAMSTRGTT